MINNKENILVIAPHCDDEVLGCGGTINFYSEKGNEVYVLFITNANLGDKKKYSTKFLKKIRSEAIRSNSYLGVKKTFFLDFPVNNLNTINLTTLIDAIQKIFIKVNPSHIFIPHSNDIHNDHKIVNHCSLVASRPTSNKVNLNIFEYETLSETEWGEEYKFSPNYYKILRKKDLNNKCNAMKIYKSQIKKAPHPRSLKAIQSLAVLRGSNISNNFAEAFILKRYISK